VTALVPKGIALKELETRARSLEIEAVIDLGVIVQLIQGDLRQGGTRLNKGDGTRPNKGTRVNLSKEDGIEVIGVKVLIIGRRELVTKGSWFLLKVQNLMLLLRSNVIDVWAQDITSMNVRENLFVMNVREKDMLLWNVPVWGARS
jgi:hypothetical protein